MRFLQQLITITSYNFIMPDSWFKRYNENLFSRDFYDATMWRIVSSWKRNYLLNSKWKSVWHVANNPKYFNIYSSISFALYNNSFWNVLFYWKKIEFWTKIAKINKRLRKFGFFFCNGLLDFKFSQLIQDS